MYVRHRAYASWFSGVVPPHLGAHLTANQAFVGSATFEDVNFDVAHESLDIALGGGTTFTIPINGRYLIGYFIATAEPGTPNTDIVMNGQIIKNAATLIPQSQAHWGHHSSTGRSGLSHAFLEDFNDFDTVKLQAKVTLLSAARVIGGQITLDSEAVTSIFIIKVDPATAS